VEFNNALTILQPGPDSHLNFTTLKHFARRLLKSRREVRGPEVVLKNTLKGLEQLGWKVNFESNSLEKTKTVWIPSGELNFLQPKLLHELRTKRVLVGPNVHWENIGNIKILNQLEDSVLLVPSPWVIPFVENFLGEHAVEVWTAGVDTSFWRPSEQYPTHILIYQKSPELHLLRVIKEFCREKGFGMTIVNYGHYSAREFREKLQHSIFAVWIGETESQSLAQFEAWSCNVPTLVRKRSIWKSESLELASSAAPYLNGACGIELAEDEISVSSLDSFLHSISAYSPRRFILESHTLEKSASNLLDIFGKYEVY
jgi:hypothetical protein